MRKNLLDHNFAAVAVKSSALVSLVFALMILLSQQSFAQQAQLIKDVNAKEELLYNEYSALRPAVGIVYFTSRNKELWKTTGSPAGTVRLKTFNNITNLVTVGSTAYFIANDGKSGQELWKSSGTAASTVLVKDVTPGAGTAMEFLTPVGNRVFFVVYDKSGKELWTSDGTAAGTRMVKDIFPRGGGSNPSNLADVNGICYFSANDGVHGYELWKSNGTAEGTVMVKDIRTEARVSSQPLKMTNVLGTVYFTANTSAEGRELWKSDGTSEGTFLLSDINPGPASSAIDNMLHVNGRLFFSANDGDHGQELWKAVGESVEMVKDMTPGPSGSAGTQYISEPIDHFADIGGMLYFAAYERGQHKIWRSDGTTEGTISLQNLGHLGWGPSAPSFAKVNNAAYYFNSSYDSDLGQFHHGLWKVDRWNPTPVLVKQLEVPEDVYNVTPQHRMISFNNSLIFTGVGGGGYKMFRYTATTNAVTVINDAYNSTQSSYPDRFTTVNNFTFFTTSDDVSGSYEFWKTNGTTTGTTKVSESTQVLPIGHTTTHMYFTDDMQDFNIWKTDGINTVKVFGPNAGHRMGNVSAVAGNIMYMNSYPFPQALWRTDGTASGTFILKTFHNITRLYPAGNQMLFLNHTSTNQLELWRTNGTVAGTIKLRNLTWAPYSGIEDYVYLNGVLYFVAEDETHGVEVWRSDGTAAGTYMYADLRTTDTYNDIAALGVYKNQLYVSALDNDGKWNIYTSNGTNPLAKAMEFYPVRRFLPVGDRMFLFTAVTQWDLVLYSSDGTAGGTLKLSDQPIYPYDDVEVINGVLYCSTSDDKLMRSDGTVCGSFVLNTGVPSSAPMGALNNLLIFRGTKEPYGTEPFSYNTATGPQSPCGTSIAKDFGSAESLMMASGQEEFITQAPNPFTNDFALQVDGDEGEVAQVNVFTTSGYNVENIIDLPCNTRHSLGSSWPQGMYILKVNRRGKISTQKIIKK